MSPKYFPPFQLGNQTRGYQRKYIQEYITYVDNIQLEISTVSEIRFNKYNPGTEMNPHIDHIRHLDSKQPGLVPILSMVGLLNDDFIGGEFLLCGNEIGLKKNSLLVWPSNFMYPREVTECTKGTRYSFVSWAY